MTKNTLPNIFGYVKGKTVSFFGVFSRLSRRPLSSLSSPRRRGSKTHGVKIPFFKGMTRRSSSRSVGSNDKGRRLARNAVLGGFFASLFIFLTLQYFVPLFNFGKPNRAEAAAPTVTWTSDADFNSNAVTTGTATTQGSVTVASNAATITSGPITLTNPASLWTVPTGVTSINVTIKGAGGGGGGATVSSNDADGGTGGSQTSMVKGGTSFISGGGGGGEADGDDDGDYYTFATPGVGPYGGGTGGGVLGTPGSNGSQNVISGWTGTTGGGNVGGSYYGGHGGNGGKLVNATFGVTPGDQWTMTYGSGGGGGYGPGGYGESGQNGSITIIYTAYNTPATIGGTTAGNVGLLADAGLGSKIHATGLTWNATTGSTGQKVLFKVRTGDTQGELDANSCVGPTTADSGCADWSTAGKFFSQINGSSNSATTFASVPFKRYAEILVRMESDGTNSPTLNDVTLAYDNIEVPTNLGITKTDSSALVNNYTNESSIKVNADAITCTGCGTSTDDRLQVEVTSGSFNDSGTVGVNYIDDGGTGDTDGSLNGSVIVGGLGATGYKVRARGVDNEGRASSWVQLASGGTAFTVDQSLPTGTVSINAGATYANSTAVTLTLSATDTGGSGLVSMQFSNDGSTWSEGWVAYSATHAWTLASGDGTKTVYAQFKDNAGNMGSSTNNTASSTFTIPAGVSQIIVDIRGGGGGGGGGDDWDDGGGASGGGGGGLSSLNIGGLTYFAYGGGGGGGGGGDNNGGDTGGTGGGGVGLGGAGGAGGGTEGDGGSGGVGTTTPNDLNGVNGGGAAGGGGGPMFNDGAGGNGSNGGKVTGTILVSAGQVVTIVTGNSGGQGCSRIGTYCGGNGAAGLVSASYIVYYADTITLDTTPPANVANLKSYTDSGKGTELTSSTWYPGTAPYFEWNANGDSDLVGYKYYWGTDIGGTPATTTTNTHYTVSPALSSINTYYFRVVAYDGADNPSVTPTTFTYKFDNSIPSPVTGLSASANDLTKINLSWNPKSDSGGAPIENYKLERVKLSSYQGNLWALSDDWSTGSGYAVFTIASNQAVFVDDSAAPAQGQTAIETSVSYIYKIRVKDVSNPSWSDVQVSPVYGLTRDAVSPSDPSGVVATAINGFEIQLTWNPSTDTGTGVASYNIYRASSAPDNPASFTKIGEVAAPTLTFYDNDSIHIDPATRINDYSTYYYRVTSVDGADPANESSLLPNYDPFVNSDSATTPDVTAPSVPTDLSATPMGLDPSGEHQRIQLSWSASTDHKARTSDNGSGVKEYKVYRDTDPDGLFTTLVATTSDLSINDDTLDDFTYYYYKVEADDNASPANVSAKSTAGNARTASSAVPSTPTNVTATSKKGNPTDTEVGHKITMTFKGSYSRNCLNNERCIVNYEVYRSTTNYATTADWIDPTKTTKIATITPTHTDDDRDSEYTVQSTDLTDATTYYYKIRTLDNSPLVPDGGPFYSGLSTIAVGTLNSGWDTTPDVTGPTIPAGGLEVGLKDTHPNEVELRNIVTWKVLTSATTPKRNGVSDFAKYVVRRETYNPDTDALISDDVVANISDMSVNYYMDVVEIAFAGLKYKYYIQISDNAGTDYKYSDNSIINAYSNLSTKEYAPDSIIPSKAKPSLIGSVTLSNVNVASAQVNWTTDQDADSIVQFRPLGSSGEWMIDGQVERSTNHVVKLNSLKPLTEYEYQIISRNYLGNNVADAGTLPQLVTTGFNITPGSVATTTTGAEIKWVTNLDASSAFIEYQLQTQPGDDAKGGVAGPTNEEIGASPRSFSAVLQGIKSNRTYTYKIKSISTDSYVAETGFLTFTTRNFDSAQFTIAPASSNLAERNITATSAQIVWQTSSNATSWVDYSTTPGKYDNSAGDNVLSQTHVVKLDALIPGTTYYYRVRSKDNSDIEFTSQEYTFTAVLKPKISNMTVKNITPYSVTIAWDTNVDTETIINWGTTTAYGEKRGKSGVSKVHELLIDNLLDNQEYHYQILAKDETGNEVADEDKIVRTPLDTDGPKITNVKLDVLPMGENDTTSSVIVSWQTNKPATTLVEYDEGVIGGTYGKRSVEDTSLNNSHTVIIKGLSAASSYHYRLVSADKRLNKTVSQDYTFVTPSKEKSILQLILKSLEETFAWTRNLNQFFGNIMKRLMGR